MSWKDWLCAAIILVGLLMFLYGANYYDNIVGWAGVFLTASGILAIVLLYVYGALTKRGKPEQVLEPQNP